MPPKKEDEPEVAAVWVDIDQLKPWKDNPRDNSETVDELAASIKRFGFGQPIVARKADGEVIAGHTRILAARKLGLPRVPVRFMDLDPAEAHLLAIADNRIPERSRWKAPELGAVLKDLQFREANLTKGTGLSDAEVKRLIEGTHGKGAAGDAGETSARAAGGRVGGEGDLSEAEGTTDGDGNDVGGEESGPPRRSSPVIAYNIVFDDEEQQNCWFAFVKALKQVYPNRETIGQRIQSFIIENGLDTAEGVRARNGDEP